jgi:hypothetical protein
MKENFLLFGCGNMGLKHLTKLLDNYENSKFVIYEPNFHTREIYDHPAVSVISDDEEILDLCESINNYIIASPSQYHLELLKRVMRKGVNILIEKPVGINASLRTELLKAAKRVSCKVTAGFIERYSAAAFLLSHIINTQKISDLAITRESHACPSDIDVVEDLMIHDIDLFCHLGISLAMNDIELCDSDSLRLRNVTANFTGFLASGEQLKVSLRARHSLPVGVIPKRLMNIKLTNGAILEMNLANNKIEFNHIFADILNELKHNTPNNSFSIKGSIVEWPDKLLLEHQQAFGSRFNIRQSQTDIENFQSVTSVINGIHNAI